MEASRVDGVKTGRRDQTSIESQTRAPPNAYSTAFFTCSSWPTNSKAMRALPPAFFATDEARAHRLSSSLPARTLLRGISVTHRRNWPRSSLARLLVVHHDLVQSTTSDNLEGRGVLPVAGRDERS